MQPAPRTNPDATPETRVLPSLQTLLRVVVESVQTRIELLLIELQEAVEPLLGVLWWALISLVAVAVGLVIGAFTLILAFWDSHRLLVAALVTVALFALAVGAALAARSRLRGSRALFAATLEELAKDQTQFGRRP